MDTMKLGEICKLISRGFNYARNEVCKNEFDYYSAPQIGYKNVNNDGTFEESKEMVWIRKNIADKYWVKKNDIILPPTTNNLPRAKGIARYLPDEEELEKVIYSQNVVIIRLEENAPITSSELTKLLNTTKMQNSLLKEVYTKETIKSISIEKLKNFKIPILNDKQKELLTRFIEVDKKIYHFNQNFEKEFWE